MKLIILDRDGVINHDADAYIKGPEEWVPIAGSLEAIARLNHSGYTVVIASNQSGLARGFFDINALNAMHKKMDDLLVKVGGQVDAVFFCPHAPSDNCECRKPKPGLLLDIGKRFNVSLDGVFFIGDTLSDINTAAKAKAKAILVRTGKGLMTEKKLNKKDKASVLVFDDLSAAVNDILR